MRMRRTIGLSLALLIVSMMVAAVAKQAQSAQHQTSKEKHAKADAATIRSTAKAHKVERKATTKHASRRETPPHRGAERTEPPDQYVGPMQVVGKEEVGSAAWYGPRHLGHRTASGDRLDASRATAAHRSLPLNSLARVTNLKNGRSVIVKVTDRGPWSSNLLIDVSPRAAEELDMKSAGIVQVRIEPLVPAAPKPQLASGITSGAN